MPFLVKNKQLGKRHYQLQPRIICLYTENAKLDALRGG